MNWLVAPMACVLIGVASPAGAAQKGLGESTGIAREDAKPDVVTLRGVLLEIDKHPCANTTGRAPLGTHLILREEGGERINLHLGPSGEVAKMVATLKPGMRLNVRAFRSGEMEANAYVAVSLKANGRKVMLRDPKTLRPVWAGAQRGRRRGR